MEKILITGGLGFIGQFLLSYFKYQASPPNLPVALARDVVIGFPSVVKDLKEITPSDFKGITTIIHAAGKAHAQEVPWEIFKQENIDNTRHLAECAASAGVHHLIFLSSVKVFGEKTENAEKWRFDSPVNPLDDFARSKVLAEEKLLSFQNKMRITILRLPLCYARSPKANFAALVKLVQKGVPLPFATWTHNRRSFLYLGNLANFLSQLIDSQRESGIYLLSDDEDLSTVALFTKLGGALRCPVRLFSFPVAFTQMLANWAGQVKRLSLLYDSQAVDIEATKKLFGWKPPFTVDTAFAESFQNL